MSLFWKILSTIGIVAFLVISILAFNHDWALSVLILIGVIALLCSLVLIIWGIWF